MKCPHCGGETRPGKTCEKCGKEMIPSRDIEVQYKDFKTSELLDIKMSPHGARASAGETSEPALKNAARTTYVPRARKAGKGKRSLYVLAAVILAAAVFFLLKFAFKF